VDVLLSAADLAAGIERLAAAVRQEIGPRPLTVVGVLTGGLVLVSDLIRRLEGPVQVSMVWASSYRGTATAPGTLELRLDLLPNLTGQEVLLVDDIFDTGRTLEALVRELRRRGAARVRSLVLLRKAGRAFVVGYGLDFDGAWRHLPYLAALDSADIAAARAGQRSHDAEPAPHADSVGHSRA